MAGMALNIRTEPGRDAVCIELHRGDEEFGNVFVNATELDEVIQVLARHRERLLDAVPDSLDPGSRVATLVDPVCQIPNFRIKDGRVLLIRHPGFGWLSFVIPEGKAAELARRLTEESPLDTEAVSEL